jgi:hypothetical protein
MKKIIIALAFILAGGAALSTVNAASLAPAVATIAEAAQAGDAKLQLVGGYGYKKRYWGHSYHYKGGYHGKRFKSYSGGYYEGFCYDKPYHWSCKKSFYKKDFDKNDFDKKNDPFKVRAPP